MFKTNAKFGVRDGRVLSNVVTRRPINQPTSRGRSAETAFMSGGGQSASGLSMNAAGSGNNKNVDLLLTGMLPSDNEAALRKMYMDIYHYDAVGGSACDLMSEMPFSDFSLTGLEDDDLKVYEESLEKLSLRNQLPLISRDYLVNGLFCSTLLFDNKQKSFYDSIPFQPGQIEVIGTPLYSRDPLIKVRPDADMKKFFQSQDPYLDKLRASLPAKLVEAFNSSEFSPDPLTTVYLPRRSFAHQIHGVSYLKRMLPIYLLEKHVFRGTLVEAGRRLRSMFHVQAGDDNWEPTAEELASLTQMFQQGDLDPLGAIITTRNGVTTQEIRQGGDMWKWTDVVGDTTAVKLRALGLSEAFLSQEVNFATAESSISSFLEGLRSYRGMVTQILFYNKMFPVIAVANNMIKKGVEVDTRKFKDLGFAANDSASLRIPEVKWHKSLQATNDRDTFDMLQALSEHGVPVPLRMWVAAGGIEFESLLRDLKQDTSDRQRLDKVSGKPSEWPGDFGEGGDAPDTTEPTSSESAFASLRNLRKVPFLARDFGAGGEARTYGRTGKQHYAFNQRGAATRENEYIAKAVASLSDPSHCRDVTRRVHARLAKFNGYGVTQ